MRSLLFSRRGLALLLGTALIATYSHANANFPLRIGFEDVTGVEELASGELDDGIRITEKELRKKDAAYRGRLLANLCGAYVLQREIKKARKTCESAVEAEPNDTAYNNRGVLRALTGNIEGAREDFAKARPVDVVAYLEQLKQMDVSFMAEENYSILDDIEQQFTEEREIARMPVSLAIEDL